MHSGDGLLRYLIVSGSVDTRRSHVSLPQIGRFVQSKFWATGRAGRVPDERVPSIEPWQHPFYVRQRVLRVAQNFDLHFPGNVVRYGQ